LYATWLNILNRCEDPRRKDHHNYGGRGVQVCRRWHDVSLFIADVEREIGPRPAGMTFDRINNDGHYEPGNVRWATHREQQLNRRQSEAATARRELVRALLAQRKKRREIVQATGASMRLIKADLEWLRHPESRRRTGRGDAT